MKIGYGTYGMPDVPVELAIPRLAEMGYEGLEICAGERWPTAPAKLPNIARAAIRDLMRQHGLELSAVMLLKNLLETDADAHAATLEDLRAACRLARDLATGDSPVPMVSTLGHGDFDWDRDVAFIAERVAAVADFIDGEGCQFALEAHVGGLLDRPARVLEVLKRAGDSKVGLNFDISHFSVQGMPDAEVIASMAPPAIHTHVKDGRMVDGKVQFLLPGEGDTDYAGYFRLMAEADYDGFITVEVSGQIFNAEGYDPWEAARYSAETLLTARKASGVSTS